MTKRETIHKELVDNHIKQLGVEPDEIESIQINTLCSLRMCMLRLGCELPELPILLGENE